MIRLRNLAVCLLLCSVLSFGQTIKQLVDNAATLDINLQRAVKNGIAYVSSVSYLPATCNPVTAYLYVVTATTLTGIYECKTKDTWVKVVTAFPDHLDAPSVTAMNGYSWTLTGDIQGENDGYEINTDGRTFQLYSPISDGINGVFWQGVFNTANEDDVFLSYAGTFKATELAPGALPHSFTYAKIDANTSGQLPALPGGRTGFNIVMGGTSNDYGVKSDSHIQAPDIIFTGTPPATSATSCAAKSVWFDDSFIYRCNAAGTGSKRVALTTW